MTRERLLKFFTSPLVVAVVVAAMYAVKALLKIKVGGSINSPMIEGDGYHNLADLLEAGVLGAVLIIARLPSSREYPFGRRNIEFFASLAIGLGLIYVAVGFFSEAAVGILSYFPSADAAVRGYLPWLPAYKPLSTDPAMFPWVVALTVGSVILSRLCATYQIKVGKDTGHASLVASGEETRSDSRIEVVAVVGVLAERLLHMPWLEYPLALVVVAMIVRTGWELFSNAWAVLLQRSIGAEHEDAITDICKKVPGIQMVRGLKTFQVGQLAVCKLRITTRRNQSANAHISECIRHRLKDYLAEHDFPECEVEIEFVHPDKEWHRLAFAIVRRGDLAVVAPSLGQSTHLLVCDYEGDKLVRAKGHPLPADLSGQIAFLSGKHTRLLYVFDGEAPGVAEELQRHGIQLCKAESYLLPVMGLPEPG